MSSARRHDRVRRESRRDDLQACSINGSQGARAVQVSQGGRMLTVTAVIAHLNYHRAGKSRPLTSRFPPQMYCNATGPAVRQSRSGYAARYFW
ncbi:unnamed protein product [Parajaminaea phylloscopi]